jgi:uncharacterized protein YgiM (DUF1202 family)
MKKAWLIVFVLLLLPFAADARSGCCSHHSGVCGCGCCDGTNLSATCAPYYPECSGPSNNSKIVVKQYAVTKTSVNVRKSPSATAAIIGKTKANTKYEITDLSNKNWVKIKFGGKEGFVSRSLVKVIK